MQTYVESSFNELAAAVDPEPIEEEPRIAVSLFPTGTEDTAVRLEVVDPLHCQLSTIRADGCIRETCYNTAESNAELYLFKAKLIGYAKGMVNCMYDSGASESFTPLSLVKKHGLSVQQTRRKIRVTVADGSKYTSDTIALLPIRVGTYTDTVKCYVLDIPMECDVILGGTWQRTLDDTQLNTNLAKGTIGFAFKGIDHVISTRKPSLPQMNHNYLEIISAKEALSDVAYWESRDQMHLVQRLAYQWVDPNDQIIDEWTEERQHQVQKATIKALIATAADTSIADEDSSTYLLTLYGNIQRFCGIGKGPDATPQPEDVPVGTQPETTSIEKMQHPSTTSVGADSNDSVPVGTQLENMSARSAQPPRTQPVGEKGTNSWLQQQTEGYGKIRKAGNSFDIMGNAGEDSTEEESWPGMEAKIRYYTEKFADVLADTLPPLKDRKHVPANIRILEEHKGETPYRRPYKMNAVELKCLKEQLDELLEKQVIEPSSSPYGAPILMVPKKAKTDGAPPEYRLCVDYRAINKITEPDRFDIPNIDQVISELAGAECFTVADALWGFWQIPCSDEMKPKTTMSSHFGSYQWRSLPMGMRNSPSTFQRALSSYLHTTTEDGVNLSKFVRVYIDDIIIFSSREGDKSATEVHQEHLEAVLKQLRKVGIVLNRKKTQFFRKSVKFLGHVVAADGIRPQQSKTVAVQQWPRLRSVVHVKQYLGLVGYYSKFIHHYADIARPLFNLLKGDIPNHEFEKHWTEDCQKSFEGLKHALSSAPCLIIADQAKAQSGEAPYLVSTDASDVALGGVLMQDLGNGYQPVAFKSRSLKAAEANYNTTEKETLAIVESTKEWKHYLIGAHYRIQSDHAALQFLFNPSKELTRRQARWIEHLVEIGAHTIEHVPGKSIPVPDALSRRPDYETISPREGLEAHLKEANLRVLSASPSVIHMETEEVERDRDRQLLQCWHWEVPPERSPSARLTPIMTRGQMANKGNLSVGKSPGKSKTSNPPVGESSITAREQAAVKGNLPVGKSANKHSQADKPLPVGKDFTIPESIDPVLRAMLPQPPISQVEKSAVIATDDCKLDPEQFEYWDNWLGPFDIDACSDEKGLNKQLNDHWCVTDQHPKGILDHITQGQRLWVHGLFDSKTPTAVTWPKIFEWYRQQRELYPATSAVFVVPRFKGAKEYPTQHQLRQWDMEIMHVYQAGQLAYVDAKGDTRKTEWDTQVIWAPPASRVPHESVGDQLTFATNNFLPKLRDAQLADEKLTKVRERLLQLPDHCDNKHKLVHEYVWRVAEGRYQLVIPAAAVGLKRTVLEQSHDVPTAGHLGVFKTLQRVTRNFHWDNCRAEIEDYIRSCPVCLATKSASSRVPTPVAIVPPHRRWEVVTMDFVTGLPRTARGYDAILTVTDSCSKMVHFVPLSFKNSSAAMIARLYFDNVFKLHGTPMKVRCDRDPRLIAPFWQELMRLMGVKVAATTAYNPRSNGQSENTNRTMEGILRALVEPRQTDWDLHLSAAEFAINSSCHHVTRRSPFQLMYGESPPDNLDLLTRILNEDAPTNVQGVEQMSNNIMGMVAQAKQAIHNYYKDLATSSTASGREPTPFKAGDKVMLSSEYISLPSDKDLFVKLRPKYYGPFEVLKLYYADKDRQLVSDLQPAANHDPDTLLDSNPVAYKLQLPEVMKDFYPVFSRNKLKPVPQSWLFPHRTQLTAPESVVVQGHDEHVVERILADKWCKSRLTTAQERHWLIKWLGFGSEENTWLPESYINAGCPNAVWLEYERDRKSRISNRAAHAITHMTCDLTSQLSVAQARSVGIARMDRREARRHTFEVVHASAADRVRGGGEQRRYKFLVLFSGTGSVEKMLHLLYPNCEIVTLDNRPEFRPTHCVDIERWADDRHWANNYCQYHRGEFDMIWASPPCTEYSMAKTIGERDLKGADARVQATLKVIEKLEPQYWFLENPTSGRPIGMKYREIMRHLEPYAHDTTYCHYGRRYMKPTTIWTNTPGVQLKRCSAKMPCRHMKKARYHPETAQSGESRIGQPSNRRATVYPIPDPLLRELFTKMKLRRLPINPKYHGNQRIFSITGAENTAATGDQASSGALGRALSTNSNGRSPGRMTWPQRSCAPLDTTYMQITPMHVHRSRSHLLVNIGKGTQLSEAITTTVDCENNRLHLGMHAKKDYDITMPLHVWNGDTDSPINMHQFPAQYFSMIWACTDDAHTEMDVMNTVARTNPAHYVVIGTRPHTDFLKDPYCHPIVLRQPRKYIYTNLPLTSKLRQACEQANSVRQVVDHLIRLANKL